MSTGESVKIIVCTSVIVSIGDTTETAKGNCTTASTAINYKSFIVCAMYLHRDNRKICHNIMRVFFWVFLLPLR